MTKRGSVTAYIIVSFILFVLFTAVLDLELNVDQDSSTSAELEISVQNFVESCLRKVLESGVEFTSARGGYYLLSNAYELGTAYYYNLGITQIPTIEQWEEQLEIYVEDNINSCINDFASFPQSIKAKDFSTEVLINREEVTVESNYNVDMGNRRLSQFLATINARLPEILEVAAKLTKEAADHRLFLNLEKSYQMSILHNLNISHQIYYKNGVVIYNIVDPVTVINDKPLHFRFAVRFNNTNTAPLVEDVPELKAKVGENFIYFFKAIDLEKDLLEYSIEPEYFYVHPHTGLLNITPTEFDKGSYSFDLVVKDDKFEVRKKVVMHIEG